MYQNNPLKGLLFEMVQCKTSSLDKVFLMSSELWFLIASQAVAGMVRLEKLFAIWTRWNGTVNFGSKEQLDLNLALENMWQDQRPNGQGDIADGHQMSIWSVLNQNLCSS